MRFLATARTYPKSILTLGSAGQVCNRWDSLLERLTVNFNPRGTGVSSRACGAGCKCYPLLTPEPMVGWGRARRRSNALKVKILMSFKILLRRSRVRSRSSQRSKAHAYGLMASETSLSTAAWPNSVKPTILACSHC